MLSTWDSGMGRPCTIARFVFFNTFSARSTARGAPLGRKAMTVIRGPVDRDQRWAMG